MGIFRCVTSTETDRQVRESGTYVFQLVEIQAGLLSSQYHDAPQPVVRFVFSDEDGKIASFANIPLAKNRQGLSYSSKSRFWEAVGALWGRYVGAEDIAHFELDIPGVDNLQELYDMPAFFTPGIEIIRGVRLRMGGEEISAPGRQLLLALKQRQNAKGELISVVAGYAPAPVTRNGRAANPWV